MSATLTTETKNVSISRQRCLGGKYLYTVSSPFERERQTYDFAEARTIANSRGGKVTLLWATAI